MQGSSHQIFHIVIVVGMMTFIRGLRQMASTMGPISAEIALEVGFVGVSYVGGKVDVCVNGVF